MNEPQKRSRAQPQPVFKDEVRSMADELDLPPYLEKQLKQPEPNALFESLHWMEPGNGYVFKSAKSHFENKVSALLGEPNYAGEKVTLSPDLDVRGTVPELRESIKKDPKYTIGVDFNSKGEPISRVQIAMGAIPYGGVDIVMDEVSMPHYGTYSEYDMGPYYNETLAKGDMLR